MYCNATGTGLLVPPLSSLVGCFVAILITSFTPQSFACLHESVPRCSWRGKGQKLFSPCIVKADIDTGNTCIASSSREVRNTSASSVCRFPSAGNAHSPALVVGDYVPASWRSWETLAYGGGIDKHHLWFYLEGGDFGEGNSSTDSSKSTSLNTGKKECCPNPLTPSHFPASHLVWLVCLGITQRVKLLASPNDHLFWCQLGAEEELLAPLLGNVTTCFSRVEKKKKHYAGLWFAKHLVLTWVGPQWGQGKSGKG